MRTLPPAITDKISQDEIPPELIDKIYHRFYHLTKRKEMTADEAASEIISQFMLTSSTSAPIKNLVSEQGTRSFYPFPIFAATISLAAGIMLIRATAHAYGNSFEGWIKAIILEVSTITLWLLPHQWIFKLTAALGTGLTFIVLLSDVQANHHIEKSQAIAQSHTIQSLQANHDRLITLFKSYPDNHVTKRREINSQIEKNLAALHKAKAAAKNSHTVQIIDSKAIAEMILRIFLYLVATLFARLTFPDKILAPQ